MVSTGGIEDTETITDCVAEPAAPVQVNSYSVVFVSAPVVHVPPVATAPLHPPEAVHESAFMELQLSVDMAPLAIVVGDALNDTVGADELATTCTDFDADPPDPVQVSVKFVVDISGSVDTEPVTG